MLVGLIAAGKYNELKCVMTLHHHVEFSRPHHRRHFVPYSLK